MQQEPLFYEDINDAIRATLQAAGGLKKVSADLWPTLTADAASSRLRDCLNHDRREKLSPEELLAIAKAGREAGCHTLMAFLCGECGYSAPIPVEPEDQKGELQRQAAAMLTDLKSVLSRLERINAPAMVVGRR